MHWYNDEDDLVLTWDEYNTCYAIVAHNMLRYSDEFAHHVVLDYVRDIEKGDYIQLWEGHLPI